MRGVSESGGSRRRLRDVKPEQVKPEQVEPEQVAS
jgi:hypothetical protein